mmetsp:Transcript_65877/g.130603  ORF Transcript_65877/g.130603 Transcript_65877/m.130603 type:complete len:112 (-) Transcript_65877:163-498(-)
MLTAAAVAVQIGVPAPPEEGRGGRSSNSSASSTWLEGLRGEVRGVNSVGEASDECGSTGVTADSGTALQREKFSSRRLDDVEEYVEEITIVHGLDWLAERTRSMLAMSAKA